MRDQWEARAALDLEAARLAALRRTPADLDRMRLLLAERGSVADGGSDAFIRRDLAFHKSVVAASGNKAMMELYDFFTAAITETIHATIDGAADTSPAHPRAGRCQGRYQDGRRRHGTAPNDRPSR